MSVEEAIKVWTLDGAYAPFEQNIKGSISPRKPVDFVVLRRGPRKVGPDSIKDIVVDCTYVGGVRVGQAPPNATGRRLVLPDTLFGDGDEFGQP